MLSGWWCTAAADALVRSGVVEPAGGRGEGDPHLVAAVGVAARAHELDLHLDVPVGTDVLVRGVPAHGLRVDGVAGVERGRAVVAPGPVQGQVTLAVVDHEANLE